MDRNYLATLYQSSGLTIMILDWLLLQPLRGKLLQKMQPAILLLGFTYILKNK